VAKTKNISTLPPEVFGELARVRSSDALTVAELHAFALGEAVEGYGATLYTDAPSVDADIFDSTAGTLRSFEVYIPSWAIDVEVWVEADVDAGITQVSVDVDVGGASDTIVMTGSPWTGATQLSVSTTGSGYQLVEIGGLSTGTGDARLAAVQWRVIPIGAADLPDPS